MRGSSVLALTRHSKCAPGAGRLVPQPPHTAVSVAMEQGQPEDGPHHRPRRQPSHPPLDPAGTGQHLVNQGSRDHLRQDPQPHALPHRHTHTRTSARRGIMSNHEAPVFTSVLVDRRITGASPSPQPATPRPDHTATKLRGARVLPGTTLIFPALSLVSQRGEAGTGAGRHRESEVGGGSTVPGHP